MDTLTSSANIVIIDDHPAIAIPNAHILGSELRNFKVTSITTAAEVEKQLLTLRPVVAIVDWKFGAQTGCDLIRLYAPMLRDTRWILYTAYPRPAVIKDAIAAGVSGCVSKSANYQELKAAVVDVMDGKPHFCPESQQVLTTFAVANDLTPAEEDVLRHMARGRTPKQIASELTLAQGTVYNYQRSIREKTGLTTAVELARYAEEKGLVPPNAS